MKKIKFIKYEDLNGEKRKYIDGKIKQIRSRSIPTSMTVGSDFELMITNKDGSPKKKPPEGWEKDGVLIESQVGPLVCLEGIDNSKNKLIGQIKKLYPKNRIIIQPIYELEKYWKKINDEEKILGCSPDINLYGNENAVQGQDELTWRCGGTHLHFGFQNIYFDFRLGEALDFRSIAKKIKKLNFITKNLIGDTTPFLIANMDCTVGLLDTIFTNDTESGKKRRTMYGRAGSYREKPYGIEYRVPSNLIIKRPEVFSLLLRVGRGCVRRIDEPILEYSRQMDVVNIINECNRKEAKKFLLKELENEKSKIREIFLYALYGKNQLVKRLSQRIEKTKGITNEEEALSNGPMIIQDLSA